MTSLSVPKLLYQPLMTLSVTLILVMGCQPKIDPALSYGPDGQPRIIAVQLPGIPDQNIQVDQTTHQITVTIPANFSAVAVPTRFQLTADTRVTSVHSDSLYIYPFTPNDTVKVSTSAQKTNAYQFVFKPTNEVRFAIASTPLTYTVGVSGVSICLPLFNSADAETKGTLILTNQQTGYKINLPQSLQYHMCDRTIRTDGALVAYAYIDSQLFYEPGNYTAEFINSSSNRAILNQTIQIKRGKTSFSFDSDFPVILGVKAYNPIFATNLFPSDSPGLIFRSRGQNPISVQSVQLVPGETKIDLPIPATLQPGTYYIQLTTNGKPTDTFVRVPVVTSASDLVIKSLVADGHTLNYRELLDPSISFEIPLILKYDQEYSLGTNAYTAYLYKTKPGDTSFLRVRLTSLADPNVSYLVSLTTWEPATLIIHSDVPSGRYQLKYEILTADKTILSSAPLERDVVIE